MAKRKIRVGVVGTGGIAKACHIPGCQENKDVEIVAVCDINKKRASSAAQEFNFRGDTERWAINTTSTR